MLKISSLLSRTQYSHLIGISLSQFSTLNSKMCYYEVLGVKPNATPIELKKAYYEKVDLIVKIFHPDHNQDATAEETFKIIAKAYETLKDPISRQIYDLGKTNSAFNSETDNGDYGSAEYSKYYTSYSGDQKYEYYYNKWYEYGQAKQKEENIRDEYQNMRNRMSESSIWENMVFRASVVVGIILLYDIYKKWRNNKHEEFVETQREILQAGNLVFESPLVFVHEKPVDPIKLQEEIQKKEFRIEYENNPRVVSKEAELALKKYKPEKKIINLDEYIENRKLKIQKAENDYHHIY